jgi:hypothetical protein
MRQPLESYTLRECVALAKAELVYCSLYDASYKGQYETIVVKLDSVEYTFISVRRAKQFLLTKYRQSTVT